jgi:hypothetical protein
VRVALHSAEALLGFRDTERDPAADHPLASPPLDVAADAPKRAVHVLDGVGRREGAAERGRQPEPQHGERLIEALAKTAGRAVFTVGVEPGGELEQQLLRDGGALAPVSVAYLPCDVRAPCFGQVVANVAELVNLIGSST